MFNRFTDETRQLMGISRGLAQRLGHDSIDCGHMLVAAVQGNDIRAATAFVPCGVTLARAQSALETALPGNPEPIPYPVVLHFTPTAKTVLEYTWSAASDARSDDIDCGHVILGLLRTSGGSAERMLVELQLGSEEQASIRDRLRSA